MTLPPERIGDKGQRYVVHYHTRSEGLGVDKVLGYSNDLDGADRMMRAWLSAPDVVDVWVEDRARMQ